MKVFFEQGFTIDNSNNCNTQLFTLELQVKDNGDQIKIFQKSVTSEKLVEQELDNFLSPVKKVQNIVKMPEPIVISDFNALFLCIQLGTLFENPIFPKHLFIEELNKNLRDEYIALSSKSSSSLDGNKKLELNLLYNFCPYLTELKVILCQFQSGLKETNVFDLPSHKYLDENNIRIKKSSVAQGWYLV